MKTRAVFFILFFVCSSVFLSGPPNGVRGSDQDSPEPSKGDIILTVRSILTATSQIKGVYDDPRAKPEGEIREEVDGQDQITYDFFGTLRVNILDYDGQRVLLDNNPCQANYSLIIRGGGHWSRLGTAKPSPGDGVYVRVNGSWTYDAPPLPEYADPCVVKDIVLGGSYAVLLNPLIVDPNVKCSGTSFDPSINPQPQPFKTLGHGGDLASETWNRAWDDPGFRNCFTGTAPADKSAFQLTRQAEFSTGGTKEVDSLPGVTQTWKGHVAVTYTLSYYGFDTDAVIETPQGYAKWWPRAGKTENVDGPLPITVKVRVHKHGSPDQPPPKKAKFEFELIDTTEEKGVCLNWPDKNPQGTYDLRINQDKNEDLKVRDGKTGQKAETKDKNLSEAFVTISCFDWGAYGRLKVTAVLDDGKGTRIPARLESDKSKYELTIPKDIDGNKIADDWEEWNNVQGWPADTDMETDPDRGDEHSGDGLTLYEEYRGFMENEGHIRGEPLKKDLFLCNMIGDAVVPGIELFKSITYFEVHSKLTKTELGTKRVVNRNHTQMPHAVDQHGLLIVRGADRNVSRAAREPGSEGIIGTPKRCKQVEIATGLLDRITSSVELDKKVAHELLHCCSVWHHGEYDPENKLIQSVLKPDGTFDIRLYDVNEKKKDYRHGQSIRLFREAGDTLEPYSVLEPEIREGISVYVARKQGQHSGDVNCVMRYIVAECYVNSAGGYVLFDDDEVIGRSLCSQTAGTGVNEAGREPEPRYADADKARDRGKCQKKICVNDKYH